MSLKQDLFFYFYKHILNYIRDYRQSIKNEKVSFPVIAFKETYHFCSNPSVFMLLQTGRSIKKDDENQARFYFKRKTIFKTCSRH